MNIRKILNFLVIIVIIGAISAFSINFYNKSKLEADDFKTSSEKNEKETKEDNTTSKEKDEETVEEKSSEQNKNSDNDTKKEENTNNDDNINTSSENTKVVEANDVSVESTSSSKNMYVIFLGSITILLGTSVVITRLFK